jgi:hypothetical protein
MINTKEYMKRCSKCNLELLINQFAKDNNRKDGLCCWCKNCYIKYRKSYYELNKEEIKKQCKQQSKKYYLTHKKERKNYYNINIEKIKKYRLTPKYIYIEIKQSAERRDIEFNISREEFINWYNSQEQKCHYCGRTIEEIKQDIKEKNTYRIRFSIDRKDNNRGYTLDNIVLCCFRCNMTKSNYFTEQEMLKIAEIIKNKT